ncbi:hypothetical protein PISMIDRAFT_19072 [Pisolithus microcarpus 441]|uniref:Uncharacterized protein n=1 Tax=Pisolithus microcarpus 441 TaxID=765257 RepID=A0A0C9YVY6_9AGAM|nr:hypothetical protein PISMIDRAFT_19072 [Pisolithus microcarpus 441]
MSETTFAGATDSQGTSETSSKDMPKWKDHYAILSKKWKYLSLSQKLHTVE